jgi:hypothetical protein
VADLFLSAGDSGDDDASLAELELNVVPRNTWLSGGAATLRSLGTFILYALMLLSVLALWNTDAPQFIYVAF